MLKYIFRKPDFPVICNIDDFVFAAKSEKSFVKQLSEAIIEPGKTCDLVDSTGEGWITSPEHMIVSPLTFKKRWSKKEIVALINSRKNQPSDGVRYSDKSFSAKRFERIFGDLVDLLLKH